MIQLAHITAVGTAPSHNRLDIKHSRSNQQGKKKYG